MSNSVFGLFPKLADAISDGEKAVRRVELWAQDENGELKQHHEAKVDEDGSFALKAPKADSMNLEHNGEEVRPSALYPALANRFGLQSIEQQILAGSEDVDQKLKDARGLVDAMVREAVTHLESSKAWTGTDSHDAHGTAEVRYFEGEKEVHRKPLLLSPFEDAVHQVENGIKEGVEKEVENLFGASHEGEWEYDPAWPFPRRLAKQQSLLDPKNSLGWELQFFTRITDRNYNGCIKKFLYKQDRPLALELDIIEKPILKTAREYQNLFVANYTTVNARESRSDEFFVKRLQEGMYPVFFSRADVDGNPKVVSEFRWDDRDFGPIYDGSYDDDGRDPPPYPGDTETDNVKGPAYELPNVRAVLREEKDGTLRLEQIEIQFRKPGQRKAVVGKDPTQVFEKTLVVTPKDDGPRWEWARRLYRVSYLLAGEVEAHICRGHLVTEQYLLATKRSFSKNPVGKLLAPFLWQVDKINNFGNPLIFGGRGILARASALTPDALADHLTQHLGTVDWFGWKSRQPQFAQDRYARVAQRFEAIVRKEVDAFFSENAAEIEAYWPEAVLFSDELRANGVAFERYGNPASDWVDESEFAPVVGRNGEERIVGKSKAMSAIETVDDLKQACVHAIFFASLWHSWVNDAQQIDGGEVKYSSMGIKTREPPPASSDANFAAAMEAWEESAAPTGTHIVFQLVNSDLLPNTEYGYLLNRTGLLDTTAAGRQRFEPDGKVLETLKSRLFAAANAFADEEGYDVRVIRSRVNS